MGSRVSVASRDESGFALAVVMGAVALITAVAVGGYALASQTLDDSVRGEMYQSAYQVASSGLEEELLFFSPERLGQYPRTIAFGPDRYTARVNDLGGGTYELVVDGTSGTQSETVLVRFQYLDLWDMNISGGDGSTLGVKNAFNGSSWIYGSLYVNGDVDWGSNGRLYGGPVFLKEGTWNASGNGQVGAAGATVDVYGPVPSGGNYYTQNRGSAPELEIPQLTDTNMANYRTMAEASVGTPYSGTRHARATAAHHAVWLGPSTIGNVSFGVPGVDALAFDVASGVMTLKDDAVIYCDDIITFTSAVKKYKGRGIIVAKKGFVIDGSLVPAQGLTEVIGVPGNTKTVPKMDQDILCLLSQGDVSITAKGGSFPTGGICAAVFINGDVTMSNSSHGDFRGSLICNNIAFQSTNVVLATQPGLGKLLPKGMPELSGFTARGDWVRR